MKLKREARTLKAKAIASWGVVVLSISGAALTGAAWLARSLAAMSGRSTVISG